MGSVANAGRIRSDFVVTSTITHQRKARLKTSSLGLDPEMTLEEAVGAINIYPIIRH